MLLAIDAGNTNIVFAVYNGEECLYSWRCKTDTGRTADEYSAWLSQLFQQAKDISFTDITDAIVSSVVPDANFQITKLCENTFGCVPIFVNHKIAGIKTRLEKPEEAGADRLVNALAVINFYACPAIVIDFGTATTFDVISENGEYCGGIIAPGVNLSMEALQSAAAKLPRVDIQKTDKIIGTSTIEAMQSGIYWGYAAMIEGMITRVSEEMQAAPLIIATGGLANLFADTIPAINQVDKDLTLRGLVHIYHSQKQKRAA